MLKKVLSLVTIMGVMVMVSCEMTEISKREIPQSDLDKISQLGFGTGNVQRIEEGYLVEDDIVITHELMNSTPEHKLLRIAEVEQYRTTNLVNAGSGRTITVSIDSKLPSSYVAALDEALARYNAQNLSLTFQRVSSNGNIRLVKGNGSFLASAGFPTGGNPYGQVKVNSRAIGNQPQSTVATIIAHEIGHCIGFRHTDYMDRSYSCGGGTANEGASSVGAVHIPGTPTGPDSKSWMLACISSGENRPFNNNDKTALGYLY
jgi:hypothetical protein